MLKKLSIRALTIFLLANFIFASSPITYVYAQELSEPGLPTEPAESPQEPPESEATETEQIDSEAEALLAEESEDLVDEETPPEEDIDADTLIENENEADVINEVESIATTGDNTMTDEVADEVANEPADDGVTAEEPEETAGSAIIETGDSLSAVNIVNFLNTNIVDSDGLILFLQSLSDSELESLDLRDYAYLFEGTEGAEGCGEVVCGGSAGTTVVHNTNDTSIINTVEVGASTGNNSATSNGDAEVLTGDAYASANILNLANTNIVGSNYLILNFDSFGDYAGDIVFPGIDALRKLFGAHFGQGGSVAVDTTNTADVTNTVGASANTGNNTAESSTGGATVETGSASTNTNIQNFLNTNLFNAGAFSVIFRVHGSWTGGLFSLPEGIRYTENSPSSFSFDVLNGTDPQPNSSLSADFVTIENTNSAYIENNVLVAADTGGNTAIGQDGALITTGDAYASASITNIANTNIIGQNWILAIINIFGDYTGNVSFGKPDLWVGERIEADRNVTNGSKLTYTYTITNNGDVTATDVELVDLFNSRHVMPQNFVGNASLDGDAITWLISSVAPGETIEVGYVGEVQDLPYGDTEIANSVSITSYEPDEDMGDNTDSATVVAHRSSPQKRGQMMMGEVLSEHTTVESLNALTLERSNSAVGTVRTGEAVTYTLRITNTTDSSLYEVTLTDELRAPSGEVIHTEVFPLGEVFPHEEVVIEYTLLFDEAFETGVYSSSATIVARDDSTTLTSSPAFDSVYYEKVIALAEPARIKVDERESVPTGLPALVRVAEAADGDVGLEEGALSAQGASIGALGLTTNHLLIFIVALYLAYIARERYMRRS